MEEPSFFVLFVVRAHLQGKHDRLLPTVKIFPPPAVPYVPRHPGAEGSLLLSAVRGSVQPLQGLPDRPIQRPRLERAAVAPERSRRCGPSVVVVAVAAPSGYRGESRSRERPRRSSRSMSNRCSTAYPLLPPLDGCGPTVLSVSSCRSNPINRMAFAVLSSGADIDPHDFSK